MQLPLPPNTQTTVNKFKNIIAVIAILVSNLAAFGFSIRPTEQGDSVIVSQGEKVLGRYLLGDTLNINKGKYVFILDSAFVAKAQALDDMKLAAFSEAVNPSDTTMTTETKTDSIAAPSQPVAKTDSIAAPSQPAAQADTVAPASDKRFVGYTESSMAIDNLRRDVIQGYRYEGSEVYLKSANMTGLGLAFYGGPSMIDGDFTFNAGADLRYDLKKFSWRVGAYLTQRDYNNEAESAGKKYMSYAATLGCHWNIWAHRAHVYVLSLYAEGGYLFGKHNYKVGDAEVEEGTLVKSVRHNGSGLTYGGGLEFRHNLKYATGNSWFIRAGVSVVPNTFVNDTKQPLMLNLSAGLLIGVNRNRK